MKRRIRVLLCVIAALAASCEDEDRSGGSGGGEGGPTGDPVGSCDIPEGSVCTDYWGDASVMMYCATGTWSTDPCDAAGACGVCTVDAGEFEARTHYYPGSGDADASKSVCEAGQGAWEDVGPTSCQ
jgi:hypothetical protein